MTHLTRKEKRNNVDLSLEKGRRGREKTDIPKAGKWL